MVDLLKVIAFVYVLIRFKSKGLDVIEVFLIAVFWPLVITPLLVIDWTNLMINLHFYIVRRIECWRNSRFESLSFENAIVPAFRACE